MSAADESVHDHKPCQGCTHQAEHVSALAERLRAAETRQRLHDRVMESPKAQAAYARTTAEIETRHETAKVEAERDAYARAWNELRDEADCWTFEDCGLDSSMDTIAKLHGIDTNNGEGK